LTISNKQEEACRIFWDYYGPHAHGTATHFYHHLLEWLERAEAERLGQNETRGQYTTQDAGVEAYTPTHSAAYCVLPIESGKHVYRALRAHRAVLEHDLEEG
jgi:hypothetical protein